MNASKDVQVCGQGNKQQAYLNFCNKSSISFPSCELWA